MTTLVSTEQEIDEMGNKVKLTEGRRARRERGDKDYRDSHNYTDLELKLFAHLPEKSRITSIELAGKMGETGIYGRNNVVGRLKQLSKKLKENGEKVSIMQTKRSGPRPAEFWIERRRVAA